MINEFNWVCTLQLVHTWVCEHEEPLICVGNLMHKRRILSNSAKFCGVIVGQDSRHGREINEIYFWSIYGDFGHAAIDSPESVAENPKTMLLTFDLTLQVIF